MLRLAISEAGMPMTDLHFRVIAHAEIGVRVFTSGHTSFPHVARRSATSRSPSWHLMARIKSGVCCKVRVGSSAAAVYTPSRRWATWGGGRIYISVHTGSHGRVSTKAVGDSLLIFLYFSHEWNYSIGLYTFNDVLCSSSHE